MGVWKGCGHKAEPVFFKDDILGVVAIVEYSENNPKDLCYDCWAKERGLPYSKERLERREAERLREVKKPRDDYPLREKCSHAKGWIGECRYAESCASCRFRKEVKKHVT